jgi:uncharacterized protein
MIIDIREIPKDGRTYSLSLSWEEEETAHGEFPAGVIEAEVTVKRHGHAAEVAGTVKADLQLTCSRCLEGIRHTDAFSFRKEYLPASGSFGEGQDMELSGEDLEVEFHNNIIDLDEVVKEEVILRVPAKPLCTPDCRGLCPVCGADMNKSPCAGHDAGTEVPKGTLGDSLKKLSH